MKTKAIILTEPKAWNFTDQNTGEFKHGNSAMVFLPSEGALQSFSNLPSEVEGGCVYDVDLGFKIIAFVFILFFLCFFVFLTSFQVTTISTFTHFYIDFVHFLFPYSVKI